MRNEILDQRNKLSVERLFGSVVKLDFLPILAVKTSPSTFTVKGK